MTREAALGGAGTRSDLDALAPGLLAATGAAIVLVGPDGRVVEANPAAGTLLARRAPALAGLPAAELLARPRDVPGLRQALRQVARTGLPEVQHTTTPDGTDPATRDDGAAPGRTVVWSLARLPGPDHLVALVGLDVSATHSQLADLRSRALTDELTGLGNRTHLMATLSRLVGTGAAVVFCDLNGFKDVNDRHGHAAGDAVLVEVARRFVRAVRGDDQVFRLGGDEFVVVAPADPASDPEGLRRRVVGALRQPMVLSGGLVVLVGVAVGLARLEPGVDPRTALQRADDEMYGAKPSRASRAAVVPAAS